MNSVKKFFNRLAPTWDNTPSDISVIENIISSLNINIGDKVLDVGCGTGIITPILSSKSKNEVIGIDISNKMIKIAKSKYIDKNVLFYCTNYYKYNTKNFDLIVCFNAYPHFIKQQLFVKKSFELLNDSGRIAIIFDNNTDTINSFHNNLDSKIARNISSPKIEAALFEKYFIPLVTIEEKNKYILILKKR